VIRGQGLLDDYLIRLVGEKGSSRDEPKLVQARRGRLQENHYRSQIGTLLRSHRSRKKKAFLHTRDVREAIQGREVVHILGDEAPEVGERELVADQSRVQKRLRSVNIPTWTTALAMVRTTARRATSAPESRHMDLSGHLHPLRLGVMSYNGVTSRGLAFGFDARSRVDRATRSAHPHLLDYREREKPRSTSRRVAETVTMVGSATTRHRTEIGSAGVKILRDLRRRSWREELGLQCNATCSVMLT
jgi:hypothetical protein